jgi:hypothetical protein
MVSPGHHKINSDSNDSHLDLDEQRSGKNQLTQQNLNQLDQENQEHAGSNNKVDLHIKA